jgi:membrane associated rhomboid family serine protease
VFIPIGDENAIKSIRFQYVTITLIVVNVLVYALQAVAGDGAIGVMSSFAVVPQELFEAGLFNAQSVGGGDVIAVPERLTLLSYMFFHGDVIHLLSNMLFLWVFGDNVEDAMGHAKFLVFYLICGAFGGYMHAVMLPDSPQPLIGASGAVSGVIAAYLILHPRVNVWVLAFNIIPMRITAGLALGLWIAIQVVMVLTPQVGPTAWWAHIGGLLAGAVLIPFMRRPGVPLFDRP